MIVKNEKGEDFMKKLTALLAGCMMLATVPAHTPAEEVANIFDNPIIEIVAKEKEPGCVPAADAVLVEQYLVAGDYNPDGMIYSYDLFSRYSDGASTTERLFDFPSGDVEKATKKYPAYIQGSTVGKYVGYYRTDEKLENGWFTDIYLMDTTGGTPTRTIIGSYISSFDDSTYESTYVLYSAAMDGDAIVRTPISGTVLSEDEFWALKGHATYNDGLKFGRLTEDEFSMSGYTDINGKAYFEDPCVSYFNYTYNLGYLVTVSNNGGELDFSQEDYEKYREYFSTVENVFTGERYSFDNVDIREIADNGYVLLSVKDEMMNHVNYIGRIKKPAVVKVMVNGEKVLFDVLPTIKEERTLVPLRAIFEALGATVSWDANTQTVTADRGGMQVVLTIGSNRMLAGGTEKMLDVPAQIMDGRTMVPARAIAEAFGCKVDWDGVNRTVLITE